MPTPHPETTSLPTHPPSGLSRAARCPPEEGTAHHLPGPAIQGEGEVLLGLGDLRRGLLCLKERVEETKPGEGGRIAVFPRSVPPS